MLNRPVLIYRGKIMPWKKIDFHGIAHLDRTLVNHLTQFLEEKEAALGHAMVDVVRTHLDQERLPLALAPPRKGFTLSEAIETIEKRFRESFLEGKLPLSPNDLRILVIDPLEALLWNFVEILEGGSTELFQQLHQIPLIDWNEDLFQVVGEIKVLLIHYIEGIHWILIRLDKIFKAYGWGWETQQGYHFIWIRQFFQSWTTPINKEMLSNLEKSKKFLTFNFKKFAMRYREYLKLKVESERAAKKFEGYRIYARLDLETKDYIRFVYMLMKSWSINNTTKAIPKDLLNRTISSAIFYIKIYDNIKVYSQRLEKALFDQSRIYKEHPPESLFAEQGISVHQDTINGYRAEAHTLWTLISRYREFLLLTDPNPYVRTRWGFSEWTVGPEPARAAQLLELEYAMERLDRLLLRLLEAVEKGPEHAVTVADIKGDVYRWLHEMGQPLLSKSMMKVNAERVIDALADLNELGSFEKESVPFVADVLSKALRADWKFHVLFDLSAFEDIYKIHSGIVESVQDRLHTNRLQRFSKLIYQIQHWIDANTINKHAQEIEHDMSDIKQGLQEFYTYAQKSLSVEDEEYKAEQVRQISQMVLEYRYLFGKFFHNLQESEPDERSIRNRFLFVDQYFESIDASLKS